jgi:hypothetical protein
VTQEKMADLKASAQSAKHAVHMLAEEKKEEEATTQKKADESGISSRLVYLVYLIYAA